MALPADSSLPFTRWRVSFPIDSNTSLTTINYKEHDVSGLLWMQNVSNKVRFLSIVGPLRLMEERNSRASDAPGPCGSHFKRDVRTRAALHAKR